ncbi:heterokaryon incompatibility protein-domain-containing protein [Ilyonectria sp. MPI-CAGE-AT-0026]|nr:heterokaryon incompatibility protein-domain-containing protein [Ilyonectria sp. MPI-CAGE-AT-0026]
MAPDIREHMVRRLDLIQVHEHCPHIPYVELHVPDEAKRVVRVTFTTLSRDQGWADQKDLSYTWFDAAAQRPGGRSDLRTLTIMHNRCANPELFRLSCTWHSNPGTRGGSWVKGLMARDVIQVIPKAAYAGWVNIVQEGQIKIEYEVEHSLSHLGTIQLASNAVHYPRPLDSASQEIRLLNIEPGVLEDPVRGFFSSVYLKNATAGSLDYRALSYCWGDPSERLDISVAQEANMPESVASYTPLSVPRSVDAAIRRLRDKVDTIKIWIDIVCVNQADLSERSQQVRLMSRIYPMAKAVHIWLGEGNIGEGACLHAIRGIYNFNHRICPAGEDCRCSGTRHTLKPEAVEAKISTQEGGGLRGPSGSFGGMYEVFEFAEKHFSRQIVDLAGGPGATHVSKFLDLLFCNPWFTRVWVIQEALLSRQAFVHCSGEVVPWEELVAVSHLLEHPEFRRQQPHMHSQKVMVPIWKSAKPGIQGLGTNTRLEQPPRQLEMSGILDVLIQGLDLRAADSRDKLFALLAFGKETHEDSLLHGLIQPRYDKPAEQVFADFTRWWIETHKSLSILSTIHSQPGRTWRRTTTTNHGGFAPKRPSWAISGNGRSTWAKASLEAQFDFRASGSSFPDLSLLEPSDPLVLRLQGRRITTIRNISHFPINYMYPYSESEDNRSEMATVFDRILDPCALSGFWAISNGQKDARQRESAQELRRKYHDHLQAHWNYFERSKIEALVPAAGTSSKWYETKDLPTCLDRCFFITADGKPGLCPWRAREGDVIALLAGGNVPYLLRPVPVEGSDLGDSFELVGECYLDGVMHRELDVATGEQSVFKLV